MRRVFALFLASLLVLGLAVSPVAAKKPAGGTDGLTVPITGTIPGVDGTFEGVFTLQRVVVEDGALAVVGTLSGTLKNAAGEVIGTVSNVPVTLPLTASGTCQILHLELGPLDLDLLGLQVHLDKVVLDITAQSGPGNLLGNLLCAIAGLLDANAPLNVIADLLNNLLRLFR